jgi:phage terminase large subunit
VDEATGVREDLFPVIEGALSTGKVVIFVMISNPSKKTGTFAQSWLSPRVAPDYCQIKVTLDKAPRVDRKWVQRMETKYGAHSPIVKIRCYGEFADDSPQQLISTSWIMAAMQREWDGETHRARLRVSADIADGGEDETVITVAEEHEYGRTLLKCSRHSLQPSVAVIEAADIMEQRFAAFGGRKGVDEMVVDGLGVGAGTAGTLIKRGHRVIVHKGGESASNKDKWRNRRVQNYCAMRDAYRDGRVSVAEGCFEPEDEEEMLAQMASIEIDPGSDKVEDLVTKEQMKARGLKSPDIADSISEQWTTAQGAGQGIMDYTRAAAAARDTPATPTATQSAGERTVSRKPPPVVTTTHGEVTGRLPA